MPCFKEKFQLKQKTAERFTGTENNFQELMCTFQHFPTWHRNKLHCIQKPNAHTKKLRLGV